MDKIVLPEDVAKVYETTAVNPKFHVPGVGDIDLNKLTMTQAERLEKAGWRRIQRKPAATPPPAKSAEAKN